MRVHEPYSTIKIASVKRRTYTHAGSVYALWTKLPIVGGLYGGVTLQELKDAFESPDATRLANIVMVNL
jgi:hypothetical protein